MYLKLMISTEPATKAVYVFTLPANSDIIFLSQEQCVRKTITPPAVSGVFFVLFCFVCLFEIVGFELRASHLLGRCSTN
jgi:hypothetical protein